MGRRLPARALFFLSYQISQMKNDGAFKQKEPWCGAEPSAGALPCR